MEDLFFGELPHANDLFAAVDVRRADDGVRGWTWGDGQFDGGVLTREEREEMGF